MIWVLLSVLLWWLVCSHRSVRQRRVIGNAALERDYYRDGLWLSFLSVPPGCHVWQLFILKNPLLIYDDRIQALFPSGKIEVPE